MNTILFSRQEFYDLVWSDSLLALSKKYNMSDNGLRKACIRMEIPLPDMGYWNKMKAGMKVSRKPLFSGYKGEASIRLSLRDKEMNAEDGLSPQMYLQRKMELDPSIDLKVKTMLEDPDQLVVNAQKGLQKNKYKPGELLHTGFGNLDISVSPDFVNRALCLMDAFIKIMRQRGHDFKIEGGITYLLIAGEDMKMTLKEVQSKELEDGRFERTGFQTKGSLSFRFNRFSSKVSSSDGKILIEDQLSKLIAKLEVLGEQFKRERADRQRWRDEYEEKQRIQNERVERKKIEMNDLRQLLKEANRWRKTIEVREYINGLEQKMIMEGGISEEMGAWLEWARKKVDWMDPTVIALDELLDENDLESLFTENKTRETFFTGYNEHFSSHSKKWGPSQAWFSRK